MTKYEFQQGNGFWQLVIDGKATDVGVDTQRGYRLYKREGSLYEMPVADRLGDLIGQRITQKWDDKAALADIAKRLAE